MISIFKSEGDEKSITQFSRWFMPECNPLDIIECKLSYQVRKDRSSYNSMYVVNDPGRKFQLSLFFQVESWQDNLNVGDFLKGLKKVFLEDGFLQIQTTSTSWIHLRIKVVSRTSKAKDIVTVPLMDAFGVNPSTAKQNRAFRMEFYEQNTSITRKTHIRGVDEMFAFYGPTEMDQEEREKISTCEKLFYEPILIDGTAVVLIPGRVDTRKGKFLFKPIKAYFGRGIVDIPEEIDPKVREKRRLARKARKKS